MHRLLERQLKRFIGNLEALSAPWQEFLRAVDEAYQQSDGDRQLLERSLELMSQELVQRNNQLKQELARLQEIEARLREVNETLEARMRQLESLNKVMMGREERILELKVELKTLQARLSSQPPLPRSGSLG